MKRWLRMLAILACLLPIYGYAQPYTPHDDAEVIDTLPQGALTYQDRIVIHAQNKPPFDQISPKIHALLSFAYNQGDPRALGQAEALLTPYLAEKSAETIFLQATIQQSKHDFDTAKASLQSLLKKTPNQPDSLLMLASINLVQGHFDESRQNCDGIRDIGLMVLRLACFAQVDDMTGHLAQSRQVLTTLVTINNGLTQEQSQWLYLILADIAQRTDDVKLAQTVFQHLDLTKAPALTAQADWLIAHQDWKACSQALSAHRDNDALLLRLAACELHTDPAQAKTDLALVGERMQLWQLRGDTSHQREQALYALLSDDKSQDALVIARTNWAKQKETADFQAYTQAAIRAKSITDLNQIHVWVEQNHFEYPQMIRQLHLALKADHS